MGAVACLPALHFAGGPSSHKGAQICRVIVLVIVGSHNECCARCSERRLESMPSFQSLMLHHRMLYRAHVQCAPHGSSLRKGAMQLFRLVAQPPTSVPLNLRTVRQFT